MEINYPSHDSGNQDIERRENLDPRIWGRDIPEEVDNSYIDNYLV
jgi:hypothetical protein